MRVPKAIIKLAKAFHKAKIDYRIGGGQAAVFYGLREEAGDWDIVISELTPLVKEVMESLSFIEIPDSKGLSWEGPCLVDFIIGDGKEYPTLEELGVHYGGGLKFVASAMMGYINWKDGESAYQHLKEYQNKIDQQGVPPIVEKYLDSNKTPTKKTIGISIPLLEREIEMNSDPLDSATASVLNKLLRLASRLEAQALPLQGAQIDRVVGEQVSSASLPAEETSAPSPVPFIGDANLIEYKSLNDKYRKDALRESILTDLTDLPAATIEYYRRIAQAVESFKELLAHASNLEKGSPKQIEILRYVSDKFNTIYDPYNTSHVPAKIHFISELLKVDKLVSQQLETIPPESGPQSVKEKVKETLKQDGALQDLNRYKKLVDAD